MSLMSLRTTPKFNQSWDLPSLPCLVAGTLIKFWSCFVLSRIAGCCLHENFGKGGFKKLQGRFWASFVLSGR